MDDKFNLCYDLLSPRKLSTTKTLIQRCPVNTHRLHEILRATTSQFRKGGVIEGTPALAAALKAGVGVKDLPGGSAHIYGIPHVSEAAGAIEKVDCHFLVIGVNKAKALEHKNELLALLADWPTESWGQPTRPLTKDLNYIEVGAVIGDQGAAFCLFALGQVLGLWRVLTPEVVLGATGPDADRLAGMGFITISGLKLD